MRSSIKQIKEIDESESIIEEFKNLFLQYVELINSNVEEGLHMFYFLYENVYAFVPQDADLTKFYDETKILEFLYNLLSTNSLDDLGYSNTHIIIYLLMFLLRSDSEYINIYTGTDFLEYLTQIMQHFNTPELISNSLSLIYKLSSFNIETFELPESLWTFLFQILEGGMDSHRRDIFSILGFLIPNIDDEEILQKLSNLFLESIQKEYIAIKILSLKHILFLASKFPELRIEMNEKNLVQILADIFPSITIGSAMFFVYSLDLFCVIAEEGDDDEVLRLVQSNALTFCIENILNVNSNIDSDSMDIQKQIFRLVLLLFQRKIPEVNSNILSLGIIQKAVEFLEKGVQTINSVVNPFIFQLLILNDREVTDFIHSLNIFPLIFKDIDQYNDEYITFCLNAISSILNFYSRLKSSLEDCDIVNELENALQSEQPEEISQLIESILECFE